MCNCVRVGKRVGGGGGRGKRIWFTARGGGGGADPLFGFCLITDGRARDRRHGQIDCEETAAMTVLPLQPEFWSVSMP